MTKSLTAKEKAQAWFELSVYEAAREFDSLAWSKQICKRIAIRDAFTYNDPRTLDQLMKDLIAAPLSSSDDRPYSNTSPAISNLSYATGSVVPLAFHDIDRLSKLSESFSLHTDSAIDEWSRRHEQLLALTHFGHIKIDLAVPDFEIEAAFSQWLRAYRQAVGVSAPAVRRKERTELLRTWCTAKILPFFDLVHWKKWTKEKLPESDIADLLFPYKTTPMRDSLKSPKKIVDEVFSYTTVRILSLG